MVAAAANAPAAGPGGWDHLGDGGSPSTSSLNGAVRALNADAPGVLYVSGAFTDAGGIPDADHIAMWNGSAWSALGAPPLTGDVNAIAYSGGRVFAGGTFSDAGGNPNADFLAVWDGSQWAPFCSSATGAPAFGGNVDALQIIGSTLYVGGEFQNGGGLATADYLLACDLATGAARSTVSTDGATSGSVYALTADSNGILYAGGTFTNMAGIPDADHVASYDGSAWHAMGSGPVQGTGAVTGIVRGLGSGGTNVYVGTDAVDVAGIPQADHVAKWDGSAWSAMGADASGTNGWFPSSTSIYAFTTAGSQVFAGGSFQNANGDPLGDEIAVFDGSAWHPVGSNGAGEGPLNANVLTLTVFGQKLYAGGGFGNAGGDSLADSAASFSLVAAPPPPPAALPPPVLGKSVDAVPEKGTVRVKLPPGAASRTKDAWVHAAVKGFVPLEAVGRNLPVGSTLDTSKGTVSLTAATSALGGTQTGHISRGLFTVQQGRKNPLTTLSMTGSGLNSCSKLPRGGAAKVVAARKRSRSLFSNVKGRFRTRGRNSTATVRGTQYLVKDSCKGTLTSVRQGTVIVRDLRLRKTKKVKAGHSYLARAPKR
jgi:hypothetical protein